MSSFYNTINLHGEDLKIAQYRANSLQAKILDYFLARPEKRLTPPEVQNKMGENNRPLTSIRRALTNLTTDGHLIKTGEMSLGPYGAPNFKWRLNTQKYPVSYKQLKIDDV